MSILIVRDKHGNIVQTIKNGTIKTYDADKHLEELSAFLGLNDLPKQKGN